MIERDLSTATSAFIEKITCDGKMFVRFNRTMALPHPYRDRKYYSKWLKTLNQTVLDIYVIPSDQNRVADLVRDAQDNNEEDLSLPEEVIKNTVLNMTWNLTDYIDDLMIFDLNFTYPEIISALTSDLDELVMHIRHNLTNIPIYFTSEEGFPLVNMTLRHEIPV